MGNKKQSKIRWYMLVRKREKKPRVSEWLRGRKRYGERETEAGEVEVRSRVDRDGQRRAESEAGSGRRKDWN